MSSYQVENMDPSKLSVGVNTRVEASNDFEGMALSLEDRGMDEPVQAWKNDDGKIEILRGHRRHAGATILKKRSPKTFKEIFPKGIPVIIREDITNASDAAMAKVDHGTVVSLKYRCERDRAVAILKNQSCTEEEIVSRCEGIFAKHQTSVPSTKRDKLIELRKDKSKNRKAIRKLLHETYKGQLQASVAVWKCPVVVAMALEHLEAREPLPSGVKVPAKLTYGDVKKLSKAMEEDMLIKDDNGMSVHSKGNPGPHFVKLWGEYLNATVVEGEVRLKAMSSKDMRAQIDSGGWDSTGFKLLTMQHSGDKDVKGLKAADQNLYLVDLVMKHDPSAWRLFKDNAESIKKRIVEGTLSAKGNA